MSAGESKVFLLIVSARGALRFQRLGVFGLIPSNIPGQSRWTSHKHRCMSHRRSLPACRGTSRGRSGGRGFYLTVETKLRQYQNICKNLPCHQQRKPRLIWTVSRCKDKRPGVPTETTNNEIKNVFVHITKRAVVPHRRRLAPVTAVVW